MAPSDHILNHFKKMGQSGDHQFMIATTGNSQSPLSPGANRASNISSASVNGCHRSADRPEQPVQLHHPLRRRPWADHGRLGGSETGMEISGFLPSTSAVIASDGRSHTQPITIKVDPLVKLTPEVLQVFTWTAQMEDRARSAAVAHQEARDQLKGSKAARNRRLMTLC
jgi:hypothetical protein